MNHTCHPIALLFITLACQPTSAEPTPLGAVGPATISYDATEGLDSLTVTVDGTQFQPLAGTAPLNHDGKLDNTIPLQIKTSATNDVLRIELAANHTSASGIDAGLVQGPRSMAPPGSLPLLRTTRPDLVAQDDLQRPRRLLVHRSLDHGPRAMAPAGRQPTNRTAVTLPFPQLSTSSTNPTPTETTSPYTKSSNSASQETSGTSSPNSNSSPASTKTS